MLFGDFFPCKSSVLTCTKFLTYLQSPMKRNWSHSQARTQLISISGTLKAIQLAKFNPSAVGKILKCKDSQIWRMFGKTLIPLLKRMCPPSYDEQRFAQTHFRFRPCRRREKTCTSRRIFHSCVGTSLYWWYFPCTRGDGREDRRYRKNHRKIGKRMQNTYDSNNPRKVRLVPVPVRVPVPPMLAA